MITCDKCGFGHKTFEEKRACKSWDEIAAAIQAAGSGAELLTAGDVESSILFSTGTFIDYGIAAASLNRKVRERLSGSPRKVGEEACPVKGISCDAPCKDYPRCPSSAPVREQK